jgi:hypothetical protein
MDEVLLARLRKARTDAYDALSGAGAALRNAQLAVDELDEIIAEADSEPEPPPPSRVEHGPGRLVAASSVQGPPLLGIPKVGFLSVNLDPDAPTKAASTAGNQPGKARDAGIANVMLTVPLAWSGRSAKADPAGTLTAMRAVADGDLDDVYEGVFQALVDNGCAGFVTRPGHEHNGTWYAWSSVGDRQATFISAFQRVASIQRRVAPDSVVVFNLASGGADPSGGGEGRTVDDRAWPGDEHVDVAALDEYCRSTGKDPAKVLGDLDGLAGIGTAHGKPVGLCEVGVALPLLGAKASGVVASDTVAADYVDNVLGWADRADLALLVWFATNRTDQGYTYRPNPTDHPRTVAAFRRWYPA